jgi:hypothetical protein
MPAPNPFTQVIWKPGQPLDPGAQVLSTDELSKRLLFLETVLAGQPNLDIASIGRSLEQTWQPDASTLFPSHSIPTEALELRLRFGIATIHWPGGVQRSTTVTVVHGLDPLTPDIVLAGLIDAGGYPNYPAIAAYDVDADTFNITLETTDATLPPNTTVMRVAWVAVKA